MASKCDLGNWIFILDIYCFFPSLADRMFRLMDTNKDGFLNFQEVAKTFNLLCKGDHVLKLRLFYCLHLPGMVLPGITIRVVDFSNGGYKFKQIFCLRININEELSKSAKIWPLIFFFSLKNTNLGVHFLLLTFLIKSNFNSLYL